MFGISLVGLAVVVACGSDGDGSTFGNGSADAGADGPGNDNPNFGDGSVDGDGGTGAATYTTDVRAVMTTDNAFSFGYGDGNTVSTFFRGEGSGGDAIFNCPVGYGPTAYVIPAKDAPAGAYLYIVSWADDKTTQGTLAQFSRVGGNTIYSGDVSWEVCAVGRAYDYQGAGPSNAEINTDIANCNTPASADAGATYSHGWVNKDGPLATSPGARGKLAIGEDNTDAGGDFPIVCQVDDAGVKGIDGVAKWMWFDPQDNQDPFNGNTGNRTKTYLLFRLPASALPSTGIK